MVLSRIDTAERGQEASAARSSETSSTRHLYEDHGRDKQWTVTRMIRKREEILREESPPTTGRTGSTDRRQEHDDDQDKDGKACGRPVGKEKMDRKPREKT